MKFEIKKNNGKHPMYKKERVAWPWKDMEVGDVVYIEPKLYDRAQRGVHVYGCTNGIKFRTKKQKDGSLAVWRIE